VLSVYCTLSSKSLSRQNMLHKATSQALRQAVDMHETPLTRALLYLSPFVTCQPFGMAATWCFWATVVLMSR
jgi:hypothetical protein